MTPRRLLLISYYYPPVPANTGRPVAIAKYLRRRGHEVHVLTTAAFGGLADDAAARVWRAPDVVANHLLRRLMRRPELPQGGAPAPVDKPPSGLLIKVVVPELTMLTWTPSALVAARRIVRGEGIDCILTTSPAESSNLIGAALSREAAWVVEFRDPWRFKPEFPTAPQRALDRRLERLVTERADRVVALQRSAAEELTRRFGREVRIIPNAWDPELDAEAAAGRAPSTEPDTVTLVHTGLLSGAWGRRPDALFEGLRRLLEREPDVAGRLRLVLAGRLTTDEESMLAGVGLDGAVRHLGHLSRPDSLALQRSADALVLITSDRAVEAPGKLFEYLGARRPVIALGELSEAARIVRETGAGVCVPRDDPDAVAGALRRAATGELAAGYRPRDLDRYLYPAPAAAMEEEIEHAIRRRGQRRR